MAFSYFYTIVFLVGCMLILNIVNRVLFMRFVKLLPPTDKQLSIKDVVNEEVFSALIGNLDAVKKERAIKIRDWLKKIIITSFVIIILLIVVTILSFIK